jgi:hypothetical protein
MHRLLSQDGNASQCMKGKFSSHFGLPSVCSSGGLRTGSEPGQAVNGNFQRSVTSMRTLSVLVSATMLASCTSTQLIHQWSDPAYKSPSFKRVMVIAVARQPGIRRSFEDEFSLQLRMAGVDAIPSYHYLQEDGQVGETRLKSAVAQAGADATIITRLVKSEQRTQITPGYYGPAPSLGFYGWYSSGWAGYYEPPRVYQYEVYISETSLYDIMKSQIVWSGTAQTTAPGDINNEIRIYAEIMVRALKEKNLI